MNQILAQEKVYVTPELKKKKKVFRFEFILSVFLLCLLSTYAIYAEYDRNKSEAVSQEIIGNINYGTSEEKIKLSTNDSDVVRIEDNALVIILNKALDEDQIAIGEETVETRPEQENMYTTDGAGYTMIGEINIPSIKITYPIILPDNIDTIDSLLRISVCKFHGANPNEIGNLCIVGHNYRNTKFFSKVPTLKNGDIIEIKDLSGKVIKYKVYDKYLVDPNDVSCTSQLTNGKREVTLITCTNDNKQRYIIKAVEM